MGSCPLVHKTSAGEKLGLFQPEFSAYGKVSGKFMLTGVFRFYPSFFSPVKALCNGPGGNIWALFLSGGELSPVGSCPRTIIIIIIKWFALLIPGSTVTDPTRKHAWGWLSACWAWRWASLTAASQTCRDMLLQEYNSMHTFVSFFFNIIIYWVRILTTF